MPNEIISSTKIFDYRISPYLSYYDTNKTRVKFDRGCLKQDPGFRFHGGIANV